MVLYLSFRINTPITPNLIYIDNDYCQFYIDETVCHPQRNAWHDQIQIRISHEKF